MSYSLPPIHKSISVSWSPEAAFHRFVNEMGSWWPKSALSIGGERIARIVFEPNVGGLIYEQHNDGRRFQWGRVLEYQPPHRVVFAWHPTKEESTAQNVEVLFAPEGNGTHVTLISSNWERLGKDAKGARRGYDMGWEFVLNRWAERRTGKMMMTSLLFFVVSVLHKVFVGRDKAIAKARGEILVNSGGQASKPAH